MGRLYGSFDVAPFQFYVISPLGAFLKRDGSKIRVIRDLSYPAVDYSLQYASVDDAVALCVKCKPKIPYLAKLDLKDAYKHIAVQPADWHLLGFKWHEQIYFSKEVFNSTCSQSGNQVDGLPLNLHNTDARGYRFVLGTALFYTLSCPVNLLAK